MTIPAEQLEDLVIQKGDGFPTYHFACVVDDELMKVTHVLRGQEHLMNTPKHVAIQKALGFRIPHYAHMPVIFNMNGSKMSKRDKEKALKKGEPPPEIDVQDFRIAGYLPEAVVNFIALLGWNPGDDREQFTLSELTEAFSIGRVGKANAKFDRDKLLSFNTDWVTRVSPDRLLEAFKDYLSVQDQHQLTYQPTGTTPTDGELRALLKACAGFRSFPDIFKKAGFLFKPTEAIEYDPKAVKKVLQKNEGAGFAMLELLLPILDTHHDWTTEGIDALIKQIGEEKSVGMGNVAQPIRVAITGSTISPSIGISLAMLGKPLTLARLKRCSQELS